jgi:ubiquinone/menaquinone biosynthesis C-methylase UbiE
MNNRKFPAEAAELQRVHQESYYATTAAKYDDMHVDSEGEHAFALHYLSAVVDHYQINTILDVGAGTGRVARFFNGHPRVSVTSIEPVAELRNIGHQNGLSKSDLLSGDATCLVFADREFDLVCEFGALHHIQKPDAAVREMLRVAKVGIFISDCNNFGHGSIISRWLKQFLDACGLWKLAVVLKTGGKGYTISEGDGLAYSYSVYNNYDQIKRHCDVYVLNTAPAAVNPYRSASHVALLGIKHEFTKNKPSN